MANYSGDKTAGTGKVSVVSRKKGWADLNLSLAPHPIRKDIVPLRDDAAIKNAVKNLVLTNFYERPFSPEKAANLRGLLFEPADGITKYELSDGIRSVLEDYEPRIKVKGINVLDQANENSYRISVYFEIIQLSITTQVEVVLQRLR